MTFLFKSDQGRSGSSAARNRTERFFHVMNMGWFVYTREADALDVQQGIELRDGIIGPFDTRKEAIKYLQDHIMPNKDERPIESWRYE